MKSLLGHFVCKDGSTVSVQASRTHYCSPRADKGPYTAVEVGYPTGTIPVSWEKFDDGRGDVFGYVPIELIQEFFDMHGGIDFVATFNALAQ